MGLLPQWQLLAVTSRKSGHDNMSKTMHPHTESMSTQFHSGTGTQWHLIADCWQSKTRDSYCHHSRTTCTSWSFWTFYKCVPEIITVITLTEQLNCVVQNKNATVGHGWLVQTCDVNWFHSVSSPNQLNTAQCSAVDCVIMPSSIWNYGLMH